MRLPDPALVVLVGASGAGKSTWAAARYRAEEVVSSDALRGVLGSGPHDLDASTDAFAVLETIVAARLGRGLTTVVDTLGLDATKRRGWLDAARACGLPAVAVVLDTPDAECRRRNGARDRPVPAPVLAGQLRSVRDVRPLLDAEGWDVVVAVAAGDVPAPPVPVAAPRPTEERTSSLGLRSVLQVSRFPWGEDPLAWLTGVARAADEAGFAGLALMDHLIQVPQVGRAWDPIPEPWVALGAIAAAGTGLELGTLCTPVTFRPAGVTAKAAATLSALTGGRAFVGVGAGWFEREHAAYGIPFPPARERLDDLERAVVTMKALWAAGTKAYDDHGVVLPETTSYPDRPGRSRWWSAARGSAGPCASRRSTVTRATSARSTRASSRGWSASCTRTVTTSVATAPRWPLRCWTCRSWVPTATTCGRASRRSETHAGSDVRRPHARRDRRRSPRPVGPARGAGGVDDLHRHPRPRKSR